MKCGRCEPDYCACRDFFDGFWAFAKGEYDHLLPLGAVRRIGLPVFDRVWRWRKNLPERHGQPCRLIARGTMNSCLIEFEDGVRHVVSRFAIRKRKDQGEGINSATSGPASPPHRRP